MNNLGKKYEKIAFEYLKKEKYKILELNYTTKIGEIDIIAMKNKTLILIEVKGGTNKFGDPAYRVNRKKIIKISKVGEIFINTHRELDFEDVQIDVISVNTEGIIKHFQQQRI
ncbi:YraN family protein [Oceanotoga sp. DSM 15011]|jgi:putative endonuclease|uniref:UPF0102 protein C7380_12322 n=1 Tax=Oceanotoga teriensis TaxID=515440 RepID=A0AA45HHL8_9BACT|nr:MULTISPECIES: YraN family protein [Oceanotoga]MDN5342801.1 putative endonuclease [Oceanotoga sp.]MDO7977680.1 YraN family protein [Oceanotoga teriensis]PWJ87541.1 putative endonuclease [Oceanotoga teriensis]UYO99635.1 YraN family protein [Oceanotoga sp. DSM 15011]